MSWLLIFLLAPSLVVAHFFSKNEFISRIKRQTEGENPIVQVEQGQVRGYVAQSATGSLFFAFQGIPYAKPPVGSLRFKDAQPPDPFEEILDAFTEGNVCPQPTSITLTSIIGDENCLFLNVYTPQLPTLTDNPLPVMVWIHGGAFIAGSGNSNVQGPDYLISEQIILVTINYRLGPLGFLYLREAAPGNVGLKDQVAALRWVQRNIAAFGGDPDKVTIFGSSAGGASVHLHMLSPMSKGLFYAAISESGNALNSWGIQTAPFKTSQRLAAAVGCPANNTSAAVECMRNCTAQELIYAAYTEAITEIDRQRLTNPVTFVPTVDFPVPGIEKFVPAPPIELIKKGHNNRVPYLLGFNNNESLIAVDYINILNETVAREVDASWNTTILPELRLCVNETRKQEALKILRDVYMNGEPLTDATMPDFLVMLTDIFYAEGVYYTLRYMAKYHRAPLYEYNFKINDELNIVKISTGLSYLGSAHSDELGYLFRVEVLPEVPVNSTAYISRERMVRMWTNFAKYRNPTPVDDPLLNVQWKQYTKSRRNYLEIGTELTPGADLNFLRVLFWKVLYTFYGCHKH